MTTKLVPVVADIMKFKRFIHDSQPAFFQTFSKKDGLDHKSNNFYGKLNKENIARLVAANNGGMEVAMMISQAVDEMQVQLRMQSDSLLAWMSECCVKKAEAITQSSLAYASYSSFMRNLGRKALSQPAFRAGLADRGIVHKKRSSSNFYIGFRLQG